ncbi:MAG: type II secretion system protein [Gammaproteobacteria bacterium]|nr:type II secretion system protein [Gammaproteobacteria bacterium]
MRGFDLADLTAMPAQRGFTLVELVTVLIVLGVLAAIAAPRFADPSPFAARGFYEDAMAATRYAQKLAIASGCTVRIQFSAGYAVYESCNGASESALTRPGTSDPFANAAPAGVSVGTASFSFDKIGRPIVMTPGNRVAIGSYAVTVTTETGLVQ